MSTGTTDPSPTDPTRLVTGDGRPIEVFEPGTLRRVPLRLLVAAVLLVSATVAWRAGEFYSGGLDPVVAAKGLLTGLALLVALPGRDQSHPLPLAPIAWFTGYLVLSCLAAVAGDLTVPSLVLTVRLAVTGAAVLLLVHRFGPLQVLSAFSTAMLSVAGIATVTGVGTIGSGRLSGGIPAATPNEIAILCGLPLLMAVWGWVRGRARPLEILLIPVLVVVIWLTGSRTGLVVVGAAALVLYVSSRRVSVPAFCVAVLSLPVMLYVATTTSLLADYLGRGGTRGLLTFSSRTYAWDAALRLADDFWSFWVGAGLAVKQIPVNAPYWSVQGLDSSWFGALVQVGWGGVVLVLAWTLHSGLASIRSYHRALMLPLLVLAAARAVLESGMFDSTPAFLAFFVGTIAAFATPRTASDETHPIPRQSLG